MISDSPVPGGVNDPGKFCVGGHGLQGYRQCGASGAVRGFDGVREDTCSSKAFKLGKKVTIFLRKSVPNGMGITSTLPRQRPCGSFR